MKRFGNFTYLWASDWWDGPLCGMVWRGGFRWFNCHEENPKREGDWYRRYQIRKLSLWQIAYECLRYLVFLLWVKRIKYQWRGFYRLFPPDTSRYDTAPIIGIVEVK